MPRSPSLVFVVNCWHRDEHLVARLCAQLDKHFPDASHMIIPDVPRLKDKLTGEWTHRYLEWALSCGADVIIKLDPDACVWRRPKIPEADWFGTISPSGRFARGGACGFSRTAAEKLVESKFLLQPSPHTYRRYVEYRWPHEEPDDTPISCQDRIVGDGMSIVGIRPTLWTEILILGNENREPEAGSYAITHPHPH